MSEKNRWLVVVGALLIQLCLGAIYAWSVFTPALQTRSAKDLVTIYSATQFGMEEAQYTEMQERLKEPTADRAQNEKELAALKKGDGAPKQVEILEKRKERLGVQMDAIVAEYVAAERVESMVYGFSKADTQLIFAIGLAFFALVMVLAGRLLPRVGPRRLAAAGGIVLGLGYILAGLFGGKSLGLHLLFIGVIGGSGIGLAYVVPIAVGMRWFPDKKGLITGLAVAGFGFGAMGWVKFAGAWANLIANQGLPMVFTLYGIVFLVIVIIGSFWMVFPHDGWAPAGYKAPQTGAGGAPAAGSVDFTSNEMLRTPQFYMIWVVFVFSAGAGLMSIGLMKLFPKEALMSAGIDAKTASGIAGTAMAVFFSLANGIGRIAWGTISDRLGRKRSIVIMTATQGLFVIGFTFMAGSEYLLYLGATLIGFNFGGNFALFPTITADTFGTRYVGQNYGWVFLAYGVGGVFGPMLGGILGDLGNFPMAFTICGGLCLVAAIVIGLVRPATRGA